MIRFPEIGGARLAPAQSIRPSSLLPVLCAALLAVDAGATGCPDARDLEFLRGLNADRQFALASFQAEILRRAPDCPPRPEVDLELGKAAYHMGSFARARAVFAPSIGDAEPRHRRYWMEAHLLDFADARALDSLQAALSVDPGAASVPAAERRMALSAIAFLRGDADAALRSWPSDSGVAGPACPAAAHPECTLRAGFKSPALAAGLSLLPGAGYLYAGRPGDGYYAFLVVSVLYGAAAYYVHEGARGRAWTLGGFGAVFHLSNVYGAHRAARETNRRRKNSFLRALHGHLFQ